MACTPEERAQLKRRLKEAREAYHSLQIGVSARVVVDQNSERVEFTAANRSALYAYIQQLESQLGEEPCGAPLMSGPARFYF